MNGEVQVLGQSTKSFRRTNRPMNSLTYKRATTAGRLCGELSGPNADAAIGLSTHLDTQLIE
jgi:hypothetical protein